MKFITAGIVIVIGVVVWVLSSGNQSPQAFTQSFVERAGELGISHQNFDLAEYTRESRVSAELSMASSVAVGDYNNDGWPDVFLSRAFEPGVLYRNDEGNGFTDVTSAVGLDFKPNGIMSGVVWIVFLS